MKKNGFSLMEMMVVLLIVAIIAAASAPMVSKKLMRDAGAGNSPWMFAGLNGSITYNPAGDENKVAMIGSSSTPSEVGATKLYIESNANEPQMAFAESGGSNSIMIKVKNRSVSLSNMPNSSNEAVAIGYSANINGQGGIAIGYNTNSTVSAISIGHSAAGGGSAVALGNNATAGGTGAVAIGNNATAGTHNGYIQPVAIGPNARITGYQGIALGASSNVTGHGGSGLGAFTKVEGRYATAVGSNGIASGASSVVVGMQATASGESATALGPNSVASSTNTVALGYGATAQHTNSVAIGRNAKTTASNQIMLGTSSDTVIVPGTLKLSGDVIIDGSLQVCSALVVNGHSWLGMNSGARTLMRMSQENMRKEDIYMIWRNDGSDDRPDMHVNNNNRQNGTPWPSVSDRRLKNVGEVFKGGLDKIEQLKVYNYTFKNDPEKIPYVGVIAQDLQKVFPNAVFKGEDGFLKIRWDEMFYALINAVKELDIRTANDTAALKKQIAELEKQNQELEKRLEKLEKKIK